MKVTITDIYNGNEVVWTEEFGHRSDSYVVMMKAWNNLLAYLYEDGFNVPSFINIEVASNHRSAKVEMRNLKPEEWESLNIFMITVD